MKQKIVTVVGARPQFIKSAPVSLALREAGHTEIMVHTGQHYDPAMSDIFFQQLNLTAPAYNLHIGSGSHAYQTGEGLKGIEQILETEHPDILLVYGDTNATIAGALAAAKLHIPVAHIEAGLRSFNRRMPEEVNRVLTDHISTWLFAPTETAIKNLAAEGITHGVYNAGDVMLDAMQLFLTAAAQSAQNPLTHHGLTAKDYILLTMHRAETTEHAEKVVAILDTLEAWGKPVIFPVHPRVRAYVEIEKTYQHIRFTEPLSYLDMIQLEQHAETIVTDSGGVQKEAAFVQVPCITLRQETEWVETVNSGWNQLVGLSPEKLLQALENRQYPPPILDQYGNGHSRYTIVKHMCGEPAEVCVSAP